MDVVGIKEIGSEARGGELERLLNEGFRVPSDTSFYDSFPVWDPALGARLIRLGAHAGEGRLVGSASARLAQLKAPTGDLRVAILGAVVTDPAWRGRGVASRLIGELLRRTDESGCEAVFLWGSEHSLYARHGFELCGRQVRTPLRRCAGVPLPADVAVRTGWDPSLLPMLRSRASGLAISPADERWIAAHRGVDWIRLEEWSRPVAYAAVGKGIDLTGLVHEWGSASPDLLPPLLAQVVRRHPDAELLGPPTGVEGAEEFLCMARLRDGTSAARRFGAPGRTAAQPIWLWGLDSA